MPGIMMSTIARSGLLLDGQVERLDAVLGEQHGVAAALEVGGDEVAHVVRVVDDQDAQRAVVRLLRHILVIGRAAPDA